MNVPVYIAALPVLISAIIVAAVFYALNYAYDKLGYTGTQKRNSLGITAILLGGWLAVSAWLAISGKFLDFQSTPPKMLAAIIPPILAIAYIANSIRVNRILQVLPHSWMINMQFYRVLMELFLLLMFTSGALPVQMTFEGRNFDIITGITAPVVAYFCFTKQAWPKIIALLWNAAGFLLVANVFFIGILSLPGPMRIFMNEPPNTMVAYFPYIWIPALIVPFAFLLHVLSIKQILRYEETQH